MPLAGARSASDSHASSDIRRFPESTRVKRILFVSRQFPQDIVRSVHGVYIRMRVFLDALQEVADSLEMLFYVEEGVDASPAAMQQAEADMRAFWGIQARVTLCPIAIADKPRGFVNHYLRPAASFFAQALYAGTAGPAQVAAFETALDASPDAIFVHRLDAMCPPLLTRHPLPPIYLDVDDIDHVKVLRQLRQPPFWPGKFLYFLQVPALVSGERRAIKLARKSFVCSDVDRDYLATRWRLPGVVTLPNAVSIPAEYSTEPGSHSLLLVATYAYGPNIIAADFLVRDVWPLVREARPDARLVVAGNKPERIPSFAQRPAGVEFTGFVPDLKLLYQGAAIVCCPILSGGGTRIKILEAAAHGKAVVSTVVGAEGLELRDGVEIALRDGARAFADACIDLLGNPSRREALGRAAREAVARRYDRRRIVAQVKDEMSGWPAR